MLRAFSICYLQEADDKHSGIGKKLITLEFTSLSDGKEAVVKAANVLFQSYLKLGDSGRTQEEQIFTEAHMSEALRAIGLCYFSDLFSGL